MHKSPAKLIDKRVPLHVDPFENYWDAKVKELAMRGFTHRTIARLTGLSVSQVSYRCHRFRISTLTYRNGGGQVAAAALVEVREMLAQQAFLHRRVSQLTGRQRR